MADAHDAKLLLVVALACKKFAEKGGATMKQVKQLKEQLVEGRQVTSCATTMSSPWLTLEEIDVDEGTKADEADAPSPVPDADGCIWEEDAGTGDSDNEMKMLYKLMVQWGQLQALMVK